MLQQITHLEYMADEYTDVYTMEEISIGLDIVKVQHLVKYYRKRNQFL